MVHGARVCVGGVGSIRRTVLQRLESRLEVAFGRLGWCCTDGLNSKVQAPISSPRVYFHIARGSREASPVEVTAKHDCYPKEKVQIAEC